MRLLLIEDDQALREILAKRLAQEGYAVDACSDGNEGLGFALAAPYDGIILDIMLPGIDGLTLLKHLRARHVASSVLLLTARDAVDDRVHGLDCGADDYLTKPFAYEELSARLRAMLRRGVPSHSPVLHVGLLEMDTVSHRTPCRENHFPYRKGICAAGIYDAQCRAGAYARSDLRPRMDLPNRSGFQSGACIYRLPSSKD